jgi:hypothetical protein
MASTTPAPAPDPDKRSLFETVVLSTPVMLTVIATFILGRSSSEMTQAQYQRSVAGQNQSKVGDQWAFFQAKRIRGDVHEQAADMLLALKADPFTPHTLVDAAEDMLREMRTVQLPADSEAGKQLRALEKKAETSLEQIKIAVNPPKTGWKGKAITLTPENVKTAFDALLAYPSAKPEKPDISGIDKDQLAKLDAVLDDIRKGKPEKDLAQKTLEIEPATVDAAMERAKANAAAIQQRGKSIDIVLEEFDAMVENQAALAREFRRVAMQAVTAKKLVVDQAPFDRMRDLTAKLRGDYKAARHNFTAQRYEDDARTNQDAAYLYEVYVLQSSARSDNHLKRSLGFMIAMLVAQVGVTVGSLAMMLKYRFPVWAIAALSGFMAIALGAYVYFQLGPLL